MSISKTTSDIANIANAAVHTQRAINSIAQAKQAAVTAEPSSGRQAVPTQVTTQQQQVEKVQAISTGFASLLALISSSQTQSQSALAASSNSKTIGSIQHSVFSQLGFTSAAGNSVEQQLDAVVSDQSIEKLQQAFLLHLQQNLFTAKLEPRAQSPAIKSQPLGSEHTPLTSAEQQVQVTQAVSNKSQTLTKPIGDFEAMTFGKNGLDAADGFDIVNVLNHLPVVSEVYKKAVAHEVSPISKLAGGYLYGGPMGLAFSALDLTAEHVFDDTIGGLITNFDYGKLFAGISAQAPGQSGGENGKGILQKQIAGLQGTQIDWSNQPSEATRTEPK